MRRHFSMKDTMSMMASGFKVPLYLETINSLINAKVPTLLHPQPK
jgi:hypothetical protein